MLSVNSATQPHAPSGCAGKAGRSRRSVPPPLAALCLLGLIAASSAAAQEVCSSASEWCSELLERCATNGCAGNVGDYYDNRDGGHTSLPGAEEHPQLTLISTGYGGQFAEWSDPNLVGKVIVGNASVAYVSGPAWGSVNRVVFMLSQGGAMRSYGHYTHNLAYWHPAHLDHPDYRDYYHAMLPTVNNSQGSSGSEMYEVKKWLIALAAFRPEVKQRLKDAGLLMPTLQMLARRVRVGSDSEYLTADAHPSVFVQDGYFEGMLRAANDITADVLPPMVKIRSLSDNLTPTNPYIFDWDGSNQRLFDTSVSIARIYRDHDATKWMVISAEDSFDLNGRPLTYHWSVLRGDPAHVRILPQNPQASVVRIEFDYQPEPLIGERLSNMLVVGAFVRNGAYYSAPAFVTLSMTGQDRAYEAGTGRILRIDYIDEYRVHPQIAHRKNWVSDRFTYAARNPGGWVRDDGAGNLSEFTRNGLFAAEVDVGGNIVQVQDVQYGLQNFGDYDKVTWNPFGPTFPYDAVPPTVSFTTPAESERLIGTVTVAADATDNIGVTSVSFFLDDVYWRGFGQPPYSFSWDTTFVSDGPHTLKVLAHDRNRNVAQSSIHIVVANQTSGEATSFYTLTPCRIIDTRGSDGPLGGPALAAGADRPFQIAGNCAIPPTAKAVSVNVTVTQGAALGDLRLYASGAPPLVSTINYAAGRTRANNAIVSLNAQGGLIVRSDQPLGTVHFILDVNGFFQ